MTKLVVLGTYWNEREWIERSLSQIESIDPDFVMLCDGCFDESHENKSTDGTRTFISNFCKDKKNRSMVSAYRGSRIRSLFNLLKFGLTRKLSVSYIYWVIRHSIRTNKYRLNQAVTFNMMLDKCYSLYGDDFWFMTYDADQFYTDEFLNDYRKIINNSDFNLITAKEMTFNNNFNNYNTHYEKRTWNNLPHRYMPSTMILPTRDIKLCSTFSSSFYIDKVQSYDSGYYFHYKFRGDQSRLQASYSVGDRKKPEENRCLDTENFEGQHPKVIREYVNK
ncbi:hypothetical protein ACQKQC_13555 [Vibrio fortis]|uniref:hypothetical protein n=1 Tax=Vibrio fortis TaxID=212667 RepID=UPI004069922F